MPLPPYIVSANVLVCERVLHEEDGVISAIRIVDVFNVADPPPGAPAGVVPGVQTHCLVMLKAESGHTASHNLELKFLNTLGELKPMGLATDFNFTSKPEFEMATPVGAAINFQLNVAVRNSGTCYVCVFLDGDEIARTPITLRRSPREPGEANR